ncbi:MAG TPA: hypothetical protein VJ023_00310 [Pyrinomonadaceae bacterium]|nr:hypothetical protein [Pyrinomonadaceae bacterium]
MQKETKKSDAIRRGGDLFIVDNSGTEETHQGHSFEEGAGTAGGVKPTLKAWMELL